MHSPSYHPTQPSPSYAPVTGPSMPSIPPNPHRPQRSNVGLILGIAGGAFVLVAAIGGVGAWAYLKNRKPAALPVEASLLPPETNEVATQLIEATRETDEGVRRAYLAAELGSEMCRPGTANPAHRLEELGSRTPREAKDFFFDAKKREDTARLLECGAVLGGTLESPYQAAISFEDDLGTKQRIGVGHFSLAGVPNGQGFSPYAFRGMSGFCRTGERDAACDAADYGAFKHETSWFFGTRDALESFAPSVRRPKDKIALRVEAIREAASQTEGLPVMRIQANPKSAKDFFVTPCLYGAVQSAAPLTKFLEGCFPAKTLDRTFEEIDSKIKAAAFEMDGDQQKAKAFHGNLVFVAKDDRAAKDVERDIKDVVGEWSAHVDANEAKLINDSRELATTSRQKKFGAVADAYFAALKKAKVSRKGRSVRVAFLEKISEDDLAAVEEADRTTKAKRIAAASIIDALQARKPVPEAPLAVLVGPAWAKYLASPANAARGRSAMDEADCRKLQQRVQWFNLSDKAFAGNAEARSMLLSHKFASCSTRPPEVDDAQRTCLASFKTAADYALCAGSSTAGGEPPESDFGDRPKR